ncbi:MAG: DUF1028 domain-containing protein [Anaerolineae bacterium]|nr:DUF1028 domain-containing protein [Anaerolineae bacterium]
MTFSIVAYDPAEQAWGAAVASKFPCVGGLVCWAQSGVGAVATQAMSKVKFGPDGLALLAQGKTAQETIAVLLKDDPKLVHRQIGVVDRYGNAAAHSGVECLNWAGHISGEGFTCQGNILAGPQVVQAMADAYKSATGELADRLVAALVAGDEAGGDRRGKQGAGVLVRKPGGGYGGDTDLYLDCRIDDDPNPLPKLQKLVQTHHLFFGRPRPEDLTPITPIIAGEIQHWMRSQGYLKAETTNGWDTVSKESFWTMVCNENLEERWNIEGNTEVIDRVALDYLRERFAK